MNQKDCRINCIILLIFFIIGNQAVAVNKCASIFVDSPHIDQGIDQDLKTRLDALSGVEKILTSSNSSEFLTDLQDAVNAYNFDPSIAPLSHAFNSSDIAVWKKMRITIPADKASDFAHMLELVLIFSEKHLGKPIPSSSAGIIAKLYFIPYETVRSA